MGKARSGVVRRPLVDAPSSLKTGFDLRGRGGGALAFRELSPRFLEPRDECVHLIRGNHDLVLVLLKLILLRDHYLPSTSTRMSAALRLAAKGQRLGRRVLRQVATIVSGPVAAWPRLRVPLVAGETPTAPFECLVAAADSASGWRSRSTWRAPRS